MLRQPDPPSGAGWGEAEAPSGGGRGAGSCQALRGPPRWGPDSSLRDTTSARGAGRQRPKQVTAPPGGPLWLDWERSFGAWCLTLHLKEGDSGPLHSLNLGLPR